MVSSLHDKHTISVAGAGLAGLTTAINLARWGHQVEVFEINNDSGVSRHAEWDAIENWTTEQDFCAVLSQWGLQSDFEIQAKYDFEVYDRGGRRYAIGTPRPFFYLVRRGQHESSLEQSLKRQALDLGVEIHYSTPRQRDQVDVWAAGLQSNGFFLAVGLTFRTHHPDTVAGLISAFAAPKALAYLVIVGGVGKIITVLTQNYEKARDHLNRSIETFQKLKSFDIEDPEIFSGFGGLPTAFCEEITHPILVGEAAGFQDFLWGFGIRQALQSGYLAARAIHENQDYEAVISREIRPLVRSSLVNRLMYDLASDHVYQALIRWFSSSTNLTGLVRHWYRGLAVQDLLWPIAWRRYQTRLVYIENEATPYQRL